MGGCGSDMLQRLGPEFGKFVAVEKGKEYLEVKLNEIKRIVGQKSQQIKNETFVQIDQQHNNLMMKVSQSIKQMDKNNPGVLDKAAAIQRKPKQQMFGLSQITQKFNQLKASAQQQFSIQQQNVMNQINSQGQKQRLFLDSQRPKIPIYDQLPQTAQKKVFHEAEGKFSSLITGQQDQIKKQIEQSLNVDRFLGAFKGVQNGLNLEGLSKSGLDILDSAKGGLALSSAVCC